MKTFIPLSEELLAAGRRILRDLFDAHDAFGQAERAEARARSDATRAASQADRAQAHVAILAANQALKQHGADVARWLAEQEQPATLESMTTCAA